MRQTLRMAGSSMLALLLATALITQTSCNKPALVERAETVSAALKDVVPIFRSNGIDTARLEQGISIADGLIAAIKANENENSVRLAAALITQFNLIVSTDVLRISNPSTRTIVLVGLAVGNVALRYIAAELSKEIAKVSGGMRGAGHDAVVLNAYKNRKLWQCRSSQTGQYRKMDFCRAHPDVSTVETRAY